MNSAAAPFAGGFHIDTSEDSLPHRRIRRKRSSGVLAVTVLIAAGLLGGAWYLLQQAPASAPPLAFQGVPDQRVTEHDSLVVPMRVNRSSGVSFTLLNGPEGAAVDPRTGRLEWRPSEEQGPGEYQVIVQARADDSETAVRIAFQVSVAERNEPPTLEALPDAVIEVGQNLRFRAVSRDDDIPSAKITYVLEDAPEGASIDAKTGEFHWSPTGSHAGQVFVLTVRAVESGPEGLSAAMPVRIEVSTPQGPLQSLIARLRELDVSVEEHPAQREIGLSGKQYLLLVAGRPVHVFEYATAEALDEDASEISADAATWFNRPRSWPEPTAVFRDERLLALVIDGNDELLGHLRTCCGIPISSGGRMEAPSVVQAESDAFREAVHKLYQEAANREGGRKRLFSPREYPTLRRLFAERFQKEHEAQIGSAFGDGHDEMLQWLDAHPDIKEELFTAFKPPRDDIAAGLKLFKTLKEAFPKKIVPYSNLAIATALTWDREQAGLYHYENHQRRTHSIMPPDLVGATENFQYLIETESVMQGRIQYVTWEFLVHVCNHRTPLAERQWALQNYLGRRVMFGKCYQDVPYDTVMLQSQSAQCRLDGQQYTLPNLVRYGGVCAMQADFAARVGKSLGVPAAYVSGQARSGDHHAWVMWVELKSVTPSSIGFSIESHGRYGDDHYYVGTLFDPQTGEKITDRDLERRLNAVGVNVSAKRHADLVMQVWPMLRDDLELDWRAQLAFLSQVMSLSPWNEEAWLALSKLPADRELDRNDRRQMTAALNQLFTAFAAFPDFTLQVFDGLLAFEPNLKQRIKYYYQLLDVYANAKRPDLSFQALGRLSELLVEDARSSEAIQALAVAIKKYADEGKYVPALLDRLEALCREQDAATMLLQFYSEFLPLIPKTRGERPSEYCIQMYERAVARFQAAGQMQVAQTLQAQVAQIRAGAAKN